MALSIVTQSFISKIARLCAKSWFTKVCDPFAETKDETNTQDIH